MTLPNLDIHSYKKNFDAATTNLNTAPISTINKKLILTYDEYNFLNEKLSLPRRIKIMGSLSYFAQHYYAKDFTKATKEDLKKAILKIEQHPNYSVWTRKTYLAIVKKFYKWIAYNDETRTRKDYPELVAWINTNIPKKDRPHVQASSILTEKEIDQLIKAAEHPRDKAFISLLYELGARIGEVGNLTLRSLTKDQYGFIIDLNGKTGHRTPRVILSANALTNWLNQHPDPTNKDMPLWTKIGSRTNTEPLPYESLRKIIFTTAIKAGITKAHIIQTKNGDNYYQITGGKRIHPHLFRHSRVTHVLVNNEMTETEAKVYFGWTPETHMISEYSHLRIDDVNRKILRNNGLATEEKTTFAKPRICARCNHINDKTARFCTQCSAILDLKTAVEVDKVMDLTSLEDNQNVIDTLARNQRKEQSPLISELLKLSNEDLHALQTLILQKRKR